MSRVWLSFLVLMLLFTANAQDVFQQEVGYEIDVELNDADHFLHGSITMHYTNNSPTTLDTIWVHLWPNGYKNRFSRLCAQKLESDDLALYFSPQGERGYIDSLDFKSAESELNWGYHIDLIDVAWLIPAKPLAPGERLSISSPFRVKIPSGRFSRLGHIGQSYQLTQWYPKFAVYDDEGWHTMPYLDQGEFFSEFGSYDVRITLPENYTVGATGQLQTESEIERLEELSSAPIPESASNEFPASSSTKKTLRFVQDQVHDFAWFADKRYIVRKETFALPESGRDVTAWAMYTPRSAETWQEAVSFLKDATLSYGHWVGEYPYDHITAVDGTISAGGGMEYPMITVIGESGGPYGLDIVISHEAGHNWFYGILASNERDHPWLDEGLNSFVEMKHIGGKYAKLGMMEGLADIALGDAHEREQGYRYQSEISYLFQARRGKDQPLDLHSAHFTPTNYGAMVYTKTALVFDMLLTYLGEERFLKCMRAYYDRWKFNHPGPEDLRRVFEDESGEDLSWCFDGFVSTDRKYDPKALHLEGAEFSFSVRGGILAPFPVTAWKGEEELGTVWIKPEAKTGTATLPWSDADEVMIDHIQHTLDIDRTNNVYRTTGLFKKGIPSSFKFLTGFERADRNTLYWNIGGMYNTADGFSLGPVIANHMFPSRRTEFAITPLYAFGSSNLIGGFRVDHHFDRSVSWTRGLSFALTGRRSGVIDFDDYDMAYNKLAFSVTQELQPNQVKKAVSTELSYRAVWVEEVLTAQGEFEGLSIAEDGLFHEFSITSIRKKGLNPFSLELHMLSEPETFARIDLTAKWNIVLNDKNDRLTFRLFGGQFLFADTDSPDFDGRVAFRSSGLGGLDGFRGLPQDFMYEGTFVGRDQRAGVFSQQFIDTHGGLHTPTSWGNSTDYMFGLGIDLDMPFDFPLVAYFNGVITPTRPANSTEFEPTFGYDAGVGLRLARDVFEVWFPITYSTPIRDSYESLDIDFSERIRFVLNLNKVNPAKLVRSIDP